MSTCRGIEELGNLGNERHFRLSTAPHVACVVPSGWVRNLIVTHFSLTDRRLQSY